MRYLLLIYSNPASREIWNEFSDEERIAGLRYYDDLRESLIESGELVVTEALADASSARHIAVRDGRTIASDGPFAEVKEQLAGFFLLECDSMERAVEIAARVPEAALGLVDVRPVRDLNSLLER